MKAAACRSLANAENHPELCSPVNGMPSRTRNSSEATWRKRSIMKYMSYSHEIAGGQQPAVSYDSVCPTFDMDMIMVLGDFMETGIFDMKS